jgi:hypothetical protein
MRHNKLVIFEEQKKIFEKIQKVGFAKYANSLKNLSVFFLLKDCAIRCIDEGTPGGLHSAGSGILRDKAEVLNAFKKAGVTEITSHDVCGAAKLYARAKGLDETKADEYGKRWSQEIAKELGVSYHHIGFAEMQRPKDFHIARIAYYDGTGTFNFGDGKIFPPGFIISRKIQSEKDSLAEASVALNIAFGNHGFGALITENDPFILAAIGETEKETEQLKKELKTLSHNYGKKVIIDDFTKN